MMTFDIDDIDRKVTAILASCKTARQVSTAINYIDRALDYLRINRMMSDADLDIYGANLRGRARMMLKVVALRIETN